jgi:hypothetical protein
VVKFDSRDINEQVLGFQINLIMYAMAIFLFIVYRKIQKSGLKFTTQV